MSHSTCFHEFSILTSTQSHITLWALLLFCRFFPCLHEGSLYRYQTGQPKVQSSMPPCHSIPDPNRYKERVEGEWERKREGEGEGGKEKEREREPLEAARGQLSSLHMVEAKEGQKDRERKRRPPEGWQDRLAAAETGECRRRGYALLIKTRTSIPVSFFFFFGDLLGEVGNCVADFTGFFYFF